MKPDAENASGGPYPSILFLHFYPPCPVFYALLFVCIGVGVAGPSRLKHINANVPTLVVVPPSSTAFTCDDVATCNVYIEATVGGLTPLSQYLSVELNLPRPTIPNSNTPLLSSLSFSGDVDFYVDMQVDDAGAKELVSNASHTRRFSWGANASSSRCGEPPHVG